MANHDTDLPYEPRKKSVFWQFNLGHLLTIITLAASAVGIYTTIQTTIVTLQGSVHSLVEAETRHDNVLAAQDVRIQEIGKVANDNRLQDSILARHDAELTVQGKEITDLDKYGSTALRAAVATDHETIVRLQNDLGELKIGQATIVQKLIDLKESIDRSSGQARQTQHP